MGGVIKVAQSCCALGSFLFAPFYALSLRDTPRSCRQVSLIQQACIGPLFYEIGNNSILPRHVSDAGW